MQQKQTSIFLRDILSPWRDANNPMNRPLAPWPQSICYSQYGTNRPFNSAMYLRIQKHKNVQKLKQKHKQYHCLSTHLFFFPMWFHVQRLRRKRTTLEEEESTHISLIMLLWCWQRTDPWVLKIEHTMRWQERLPPGYFIDSLGACT